ncbi:HAD-IB family hydrolase [Vibrio harveyi]|uniref:HAD phosphoserine phosphatase-like hydrolase, IB family protein n=1 Tax=Vibrio harveyi TaxID=669 RepID=A0A454CTQ4_VIBHA|nr:HAD-IB family hydrolase [Vibrio harveyi]APP08865.1 HAD family hydrolase [Vibrio harveyi]AWB02806.1 HAD-IB family hydrolase [Vibrio harveyi]EKM29773.1 HAD phosphoserine phosphatase-like hydrolase, IB family protein [Vibrio harveyi]EKO3786566.1 HAD-IB family hydrolase [Vibrio harveyi]EKO3787156.1 HAD-IB family hydrolase [Vibrio harveyi]
MSDSRKPALALFDFDGTITDEDMFSLFLHYSVTGPRKWLGNIIILPFYAMYKAGFLPARRMRPIASFVAFAGRQTDEVKTLGARFAQEIIVQHIRPEAKTRLDWHHAQGDTIVVVSASLNAYLKPWCDTQGYHLLCSELLGNSTRISGLYHSKDCSLERKVERVQAKFDVSQYQAIYAYGDTHEDIPMLKLAKHATMNWQPWSASRSDS